MEEVSKTGAANNVAGRAEEAGRKYTYMFPKARVVTNCVIIGLRQTLSPGGKIEQRKLHVLLVRKQYEKDDGKRKEHIVEYSLPESELRVYYRNELGEVLENDESLSDMSLEACASRGLTGYLKTIRLHVYKAYGNEDRDKSMRTVAIALWGVVRPELAENGELPPDWIWKPINHLRPADLGLNNLNFALDHRRMILDAMATLRKEPETIDFSLLDEKFTMHAYRDVRSALLGVEGLDAGNFSKKVARLVEARTLEIAPGTGEWKNKRRSKIQYRYCKDMANGHPDKK